MIKESNRDTFNVVEIEESKRKYMIFSPLSDKLHIYHQINCIIKDKTFQYFVGEADTGGILSPSPAARLEELRNSPPVCCFVAPCPALRRGVRSNSWFESLLLMKKRRRPTGHRLFWRRRGDSNSCAGYPTYALSRGASSPT